MNSQNDAKLPQPYDPESYAITHERSAHAKRLRWITIPIFMLVSSIAILSIDLLLNRHQLHFIYPFVWTACMFLIPTSLVLLFAMLIRFAERAKIRAIFVFLIILLIVPVGLTGALLNSSIRSLVSGSYSVFVHVHPSDHRRLVILRSDHGDTYAYEAYPMVGAWLYNEQDNGACWIGDDESLGRHKETEPIVAWPDSRTATVYIAGAEGLYQTRTSETLGGEFLTITFPTESLQRGQIL